MKKAMSLILVFAIILCLVPMTSFAETEEEKEIYRYSVLILDISGSMEGVPAENQRIAAVNFCESILNASGNNYISIVSLNRYGKIVCDFTNDLDTAIAAVNSLETYYGGTNIEDALSVAGKVLDKINHNGENIIKNIILCSDGLPENGNRANTPYSISDMGGNYQYANAAYQTAAKLKENYLIYTLGFFHSLAGKELEYGSRLMTDLQNAGYYEVTDPEDLVFEFGNVADRVLSDSCALAELTPIDYLAMSDLSYTTDLPVGETIKNALDDKWDKLWSGTDITYGELFEHIAGWQILEIGKDDNTGFFARAFRNAANEIVIAYRGSAEVGKEGWEADWILNNLVMFAGDNGQQIGQAFEYYNYLLKQYQPKTVAVTGHSLGGGLADIVSARYGCKGLSFNSAPFLDIAYQYYPIEMSENFHAVAYYNFVDIANQYDVVGNYTAETVESYLNILKEFLFDSLDEARLQDSIREYCKQKLADAFSYFMTLIHNKLGQELEKIKPKEVHDIMYWKDSDKNDLFYPHFLQSLVTRDESGKVVLTDMISLRKPNNVPILQWHTTLEIDKLIKEYSGVIEAAIAEAEDPTNALSEIDIISLISEITKLISNFFRNSHELMLGVDERFPEYMSWQSKDTYVQVFGGDGVDKYVTSIKNDTIVGGWGNDELDGSYGNDVYYYHKGDGVDIIRDIAGDDKLVLCGFSENATIDRVKKDGWILVSVDGELIATVLDSRAMPTKNPFDIDLAENMTGEPKESPKINIDFSGGKYYKNHIVIACPVNVEIYNSKTGEVVYTLTDGEEGSYYTDYGNFYIVSEENGDGYAKVLDLLDGYDLRILGNGGGTMNVDVYDSDGHELAEAVSANDVPVTPTMTATIEEVGERKNLVIDYDGDGVTDSVVPLAAPVVVSFDANGGTGEMAEVSVAAGGAYELPECGFIAPEGQTFQGWDVNGTVYAPGDKVTVTEDVTIKALWSAASGGVTPPSGESGGSQTPPTQGPVPTVTPPSTGGASGSTTVPSTRPTSPNDTPRTGDFSTPALWVCLMAASGLAAAVLARTGKKKRK